MYVVYNLIGYIASRQTRTQIKGINGKSVPGMKRVFSAFNVNVINPLSNAVEVCTIHVIYKNIPY